MRLRQFIEFTPCFYPFLKLALGQRELRRRHSIDGTDTPRAMSSLIEYPTSPKDALVAQYVGKSISDVHTPAAILNVAAIRRNCERMLEACKSLKLGWRAHVKTHKVGGRSMASNTEHKLIMKPLDGRGYAATSRGRCVFPSQSCRLNPCGRRISPPCPEGIQNSRKTGQCKEPHTQTLIQYQLTQYRFCTVCR